MPITQPFNEYLASLAGTTSGAGIVAALGGDNSAAGLLMPWFFAETHGMGPTRTAAQNRTAFTAVLAAAGKNPILLPAGILDFAGDQFTISGTERFIAKAGSSSEGFIRTTPTLTGGWFTFTCSKLTLRNIGFDGNKGALGSGDGWTVILSSACLDKDVEGCGFLNGRGSLGYGLFIDDTQNGSGVDGESRTRVVNNRFNGNDKSGLWVGAGDNIEVSGNTANDNVENGIRIDWMDTSFLKQVRRGSITDNRTKGNGSTGLSVGNPNKTNLNGATTVRWGAGNPDTEQIVVKGNHSWENAAYGYAICGKNVAVSLNTAKENGSAAMLLVGEQLTVTVNELIAKAGTSWCIDAGETVNSNISFNQITGAGVGLSVGASKNLLAVGNTLLGQTVSAIGGTPIETDGSGKAFQGAGENITLRGNKIGLTSGVKGVFIENGFPNVNAEFNDFWLTDGSDETTGQLNAIIIVGKNTRLKGNTWKGNSYAGVVPNTGDIVYPDLFDELLMTASNPTISSFRPYSKTLYQQKVAFVEVTNGGSGYTSAPTVGFSGGGGSGAAATAFIDQGGVVRGIRMTNFGSGYTSTPTVGFSGGGGSGAAATATVGLALPRRMVELHCQNGATFSSGVWPAFGLPGNGGSILAGQTARIQHVYDANVLQGPGYENRLRLVDGASVPSTPSGSADIYVDVADGDLKIKFGDGTVKTIATDT